MKRTKKLAMFGLILVLAVSVFSARLFMPVRQADAALGAADIYTVANTAASGFSNWQAEYKLGDTITNLPPATNSAVLKITKPGGTVETVTGSSYKPENAGYYSAVYTVSDKPVTKEFKFYVSAEAYSIELPFYGAEIPTYLQKGKTFTLPKADVVYTDDRGEVQKVDNPTVKVAVTDVGAGKEFDNINTATDAARVITADKGGKIFISYAYKVGVTYIQKNFIVIVEETVTDNEDPKLVVSGMPTTVAQMTKLELPLGNATDNKDQNVKVVVTVTAPDGTSNIYNVKDYMLDKDSGYIKDEYKDKSKTDYYVSAANKVTLDNNHNRTFYPDQKGPNPYVITYEATDDSGRTAKTVFNINVEDTKEPYLKVDAKVIPKEWGNSKITKIDPGNANNNITYDFATAGDKPAFNLYIPANDYIDNVSLKGEMTENTIELFKGAVLVDTAKLGTDLVTFTSTNGKIKQMSAPDNRVYLYELDAGADYELRYSVKDATNHTKTQSTSIKVVSDFTDTTKPEITYANTVNTVRSGSSFSKASVTANDNKGAVKLDYKFVLSKRTNNLEKEDASDIDFTESKHFYNDTIKKLDVNAIQAGAASAGYNKILIQATAVDGAGNSVSDVRVVNIIDTKVPTDAPVISGVKQYVYTNLVPAAAATDMTDTNLGTISANKEFVLPSVMVTQNGIDNYLGFQFDIRDNAGKVVNLYTETTFWTLFYKNAQKTELYIKDFKFTPDKSGNYTIVLSVFNVSGASSSVSLQLTVESSEGDIVGPAKPVHITTAADIPETLEYGKTMDLPDMAVYKADKPYNNPEDNDPITGIYNEDKVYRTTISGPQYSVQGRQFTALMTGNYIVKHATASGSYQSYEGTTKVNDSVVPTIKLTGIIPTASVLEGNTVYIPNFVATHASGIEVKDVSQSVSIKNGGNTEQAVPTDSSDDVKYAGMLKFKPFSDGTKISGKYTITYSAVSLTGSSHTESFTIDIGDVYVPVITLKDGKTYATSMKQNANFKFLDYDAIDEYYASNGEFTSKNVRADVKVTLTAPDGTVPYEFTSTSSKKPDSLDAHKLDKAGVYTVTYTVTDAAGNETKQEYKITVDEKTKTPVNNKVLTVILVTVGVLALAGVVLYFVRYRRKV